MSTLFCRNTSIGTSGSGSTSAYASDSDSLIIDVSSGNENEALNNNSSGTAESPWPYLDCFFKLKIEEKNAVKLECLLCKPRRVEILSFTKCLFFDDEGNKNVCSVR